MRLAGRKIWDAKKCKIEAAKYSTRDEFKKQCQTGYKIARELGILDSICSHMLHGGTIWTKDLCKAAASTYNSRILFQKAKQGAYQAARKNGWLTEICSHMPEYKKSIGWTKDKCAEEAKKYGSKTDFNKNSRGAYSSAYNNGWLAEICVHMHKENQNWTEHLLRVEAQKYLSKGEFKQACQSGYKAAIKLGLLDEICGDMQNLKTKWTKNKIEQLAKKYKKRSHFQRNEPGAYAHAKSHKFIEEVCSHMDPPVKAWNISSLKTEALKYAKMSDFVKNSYGAYQAAINKKCLDIITVHMAKKVFWTKEKCRVEAKKYKTRKEFCDENGAAYQYALRHGFLDDICEHMIVLGNKYHRMIYAYEFPDNFAYVGLTYNEEKRKYEHLYEKLGPVRQHIMKTNLTPIYKKLHDYMPVEQAKELEHYCIKKYKSEGWNLLNTSKAGALGGNNTKWTKEECHKVALMFEKKQDFVKHPDYGGAVNAARKHKWMNDICAHMTKGNVKWDFNKCVIEARKYTRKTDFMRQGKGAYGFAVQNGFLAEICIHMKGNANINKVKWTKEECHRVALLFNKKVDFEKHYGGAVNAARKQKWIDEICSHMTEGNIKWDAQRCKVEAQKYTKKTDFMRNGKGAYSYAISNGLLEDICSHME